MERGVGGEKLYYLGMAGFHVLTKPIGPICNLDCRYCFYLEKEKLYPEERKWAMGDEVLESYVRQYIAAQPADEVYFAWQGGEPTLLGVEFFRKTVELQQRFSRGKQVHNAMQTNGTLLDDEWCDFLAANGFLVGLSIDGPAEMHDRYRADKQGRATFESVMRGLGFLQKHGVEFNTLTVVNRSNAQEPIELYEFLKSIGSRFLQFIPLVERKASVVELTVGGLTFAEPPIGGMADEAGKWVTEWSAEPGQYGNFLCEIFDHWVRRDVGEVFVQLFDVALSNWMGLGSPLCVFAEECGAAMAMEHNGDLYSCDHYVYQRYKLGNILSEGLGEMADSPAQRKFGADKRATLPRYCRECEVRFACNGECPKHRFAKTPDGEEGLNYLCAAYKRFFNHVDPYMREMGRLVASGREAAEIMQLPKDRVTTDCADDTDQI
jgi:uncharacterized protein